MYYIYIYMSGTVNSGQKGDTTSESDGAGNSASSDMGPNAISINIGGQGWGVGKSARGAEGPTSNQSGTPAAFGDADNYGRYGSAVSPVSGYSLTSGSRAGGRRRKRRRRGKRSRRRSKRRTRRRRRKTRSRRHRRRHRRRRTRRSRRRRRRR